MDTYKWPANLIVNYKCRVAGLENSISSKRDRRNSSASLRRELYGETFTSTSTNEAGDVLIGDKKTAFSQKNNLGLYFDCLV